MVKKKLIKIYGKKYLKPLKLIYPGDPSRAAFFSALTLLNPNLQLKLKMLG